MFQVNRAVSSPNMMIFRVLEDYAVVFFGSALFKTLRLFIVAAFSIHFFACIFYRVKVPSDSFLLRVLKKNCSIAASLQ
jgi:hypothetical protein